MCCQTTCAALYFFVISLLWFNENWFVFPSYLTWWRRSLDARPEQRPRRMGCAMNEMRGWERADGWMVKEDEPTDGASAPSFHHIWVPVVGRQVSVCEVPVLSGWNLGGGWDVMIKPGVCPKCFSVLSPQGAEMKLRLGRCLSSPSCFKCLTCGGKTL